MSVIDSIIAWLEKFNPEEYWKMKNIQTDIHPAKANSYSLCKEPIQNVKTYINGSKVINGYYAIIARLPSQDNASRISNEAWGEALEGWISEQNRKKNFPVIEESEVETISVSTPFCLGTTETNDSLYQMTISIKYKKG